MTYTGPHYPQVARRHTTAWAAAAALAGLTLLGALGPAHAVGVSGQGSWESTLEGRDLDGDLSNGYEAYYDTVLKITWLADANHAKTSGFDSDGLMNWDTAKAWAAGLNVNGVTGWRLPDVKPVNGSSFNNDFSSDGSTDFAFNITSPQSEMAHLYHVTLGNKSYFDKAGNVQTGWGWSNTGLFSNVQSKLYWSGVEFDTNERAWAFDAEWGNQLGNGSKVYGFFYAWAVRSGDVASPVPEPQTIALALAGLAVAGVAARRRRR